MELRLKNPQDQEEALVEALLAGDEGALNELMQLHDAWVRSAVFSVLGKPDEIDDVVQQVWLRVWQRKDTLDDVSRWRYWLYRMAKNAAIDAGRKKTRRRSAWKRLVRLTGPQAGTLPAQAEQQMMLNEQQGQVMDAIAGLPEIYREPFVLRHLQDLSYREIAEMMGLPVDTVETRLVRARRLLRQSLKHLKDG